MSTYRQIMLILTCLQSVPALAQSPSQILAPTGTLRAIFLGGNPVQGTVDSKTGVARGPVPDLVQELARRLNVPYKIIPAPAAGGVIEALKNGTADIGFLVTMKPAHARWTLEPHSWSCSTATWCGRTHLFKKQRTLTGPA